MNIPRYWSKATKEVTLENDRRMELVAWGWSVTDELDAARKAEDRLSTMMSRARFEKELEKYPYGRSPLREEIQEEHGREGDESHAVVTRNTYGSLVLNTANIMFIDVDLPQTSSGGFLKRLFRKEMSVDVETDALAGIRNALKNVPGGSFRVYRTAGGFRILATDPLYDPASASAEDIMKAAHVDPAFLQLCRFQKSFRARLTPKPWRCNLPLPPGSHPRESKAQRNFERWLERYAKACASKATCRFVEEVGWGRVNRVVEPILRLHDQKTRAAEALPLA